MTLLAGVLVAAAGSWLVGLAAAIAVAPMRAAQFLERFASSARAHFTEQALRLVAGVAFILFAPEMRFGDVFRIFGWIVTVTAVVLFLLPWRWHQRFGEWVIPMATGHLRLFGAGAFALGSFILYAAL